MYSSQTHTPRALASLATAVFAVLVWALPARAADAIFPTGSRIGLVPPLTMPLSSRFMGFEDADAGAGILLSTLPGDAFKYLDKSMVPEALAKQGIDTREPFTAAGATGFLLSGTQTNAPAPIHKWMLVAPVGDLTALVTVRTPDPSSKYSDQIVRAALSTLAVRASVPDAERLSLLPFKVGDLAGFRIDDVLPGRALMLVHEPAGGEHPDKASNDTNKDAAGHSVDARLLIAALPGGPTEPKDDDNFAQVTFDRIGGIGNVRIQDAEPLRINGQPGYQTLATAKDAQGADLMVVQWLRFGTGGYMQMIGIAHAELWPEMLTQFRKVRDGIDAE
jgi:hypothetical protein